MHVIIGLIEKHSGAIVRVEPVADSQAGRRCGSQQSFSHRTNAKEPERRERAEGPDQTLRSRRHYGNLRPFPLRGGIPVVWGDGECRPSDLSHASPAPVRDRQDGCTGRDDSRVGIVAHAYQVRAKVLVQFGTAPDDARLWDVERPGASGGALVLDNGHEELTIIDVA